MYIDVKNISVEFKDKNKTQTVLDDISLEIEKGEFICILGFSGCGKSTLLNVMAGLLQPTKGEVIIDGKIVKNPTIKNVTIFQNYGLLPWRTVEKNVELGLETQKIPKAERSKIAEKYIDMVGLTASKNKHPCQLSGGMQQRVAIARALAVNPDVLFMDEPFGALDVITRMKLQEDISRISQDTKTTVIFVTYDIEEAIFLADRVVVLDSNPGVIKSIINIKMPKHRDRTSSDFLYARDKIYEVFNMKTKDIVEYYI